MSTALNYLDATAILGAGETGYGVVAACAIIAVIVAHLSMVAWGAVRDGHAAASQSQSAADLPIHSG